MIERNHLPVCVIRVLPISFTVGKSFDNTRPMPIHRHLLAFTFTLTVTSLPAQNTFPDGRLDPTRNPSTTSQPLHAPLPEQYICTSGDITVRPPDRSNFPCNLSQ